MSIAKIANTVVDSATAVREWLDWPGVPFDWRQEDSFIQNEFFRYIHKFANDQCALRWEHKIDTDAGRFRLDFLLCHRTTGRAVGIECDGRDFHTIARDSQRDQAIIRTGRVAEIYRIRGKDIHYCVLDVLQLIAQREPWIVRSSFHEQATFDPHPTTYRDEMSGCLEGGYQGIMRTYFDQVERDEQFYIECGCEGDCDCRYTPQMVESKERTPTVIRYMSAAGHPSAFEDPEYLIPLPIPEWKRALARDYHATHPPTNGEQNDAGNSS